MRGTVVRLPPRVTTSGNYLLYNLLLGKQDYLGIIREEKHAKKLMDKLDWTNKLPFLSNCFSKCSEIQQSWTVSPFVIGGKNHMEIECLGPILTCYCTKELNFSQRKCLPQTWPLSVKPHPPHGLDRTVMTWYCLGRRSSDYHIGEGRLKLDGEVQLHQDENPAWCTTCTNIECKTD